ncbi:hypothetical protein M406DRAFT_272236 [Cryphonectria parasitica EP155]|uniref:CASTOR ACT domain-containing protein n=1 Tax=Cryphonectria parasitica (strain ATCC 38755 / EP155) TaxID=660469 RepID=A0A9P5CUU7_CRYP1|nr:uncharacterized protein M406DRAFT_272236 [Cryphonectria parasitica EP155]KAF3770912.1 hypothetical protein M406DRAFT_272236 [Cryphonectria parasitica EP155]
MNAEITFLDETLSLIHIPLSLYSQFLQPILRILLPPSIDHGAASVEDHLDGLTLDQKHGFLNISVTPIECSVVCHDAWAKQIFKPIIERLPKDVAKTVSMSKESYCVLRVSSPGMDAGSRVVDLTSPLALAGIPIFFITSYYSDFIIVPSRHRQSVVHALLSRGFECPEDSHDSFVSPGALSHSRGLSQESDEPPSTPPPSNVAELQVRTFKMLKKHNVVPNVERGLLLIHCSGKEAWRDDDYSRPSRSHSGNGNHRKASWVDMVDTKFYTSLVAALVSQPRFLSVTMTEEDEASLLIDKSLLDKFGDSLIGPTEVDLVPIFLDLVDLPFEATGIVAGVAGKLAEELQMEENAELSYLSTAKTGAVILSSELADKAMETLSPLLVKHG